MIGDTTHDMEMARAAGVSRLGVAYGAHARAELLECEPLACVEDIAELRRWLLRHA
jgi:phosphoglycolate phosphatase